MTRSACLDRRSPVPLFYQVAEDLKRRLAGGRYRVGGKFMPVRQVAEEYGVSFVTAQRSMARLADESWLLSERGRGTVVARKPKDPRGAGSSQSIAARRVVVLWPTDLTLGPALQSQLLATIEGIRSSLSEYSLSIELGADTLIEENTRSYLDALRQDPSNAGFVLVSVPAHVKQYFAHHELPSVVLGNVEPGIELSCVSTNEDRAIFDLTNHLISLGHERIAHVLNAPRVAGHEDRLTGYRRALRDAGLPHRAEHEVTVAYNRELASARFHELMSRSDAPTAAICTGMTPASWLRAVAGKDFHVAYDVDREQSETGLVPSTLLIWPGGETGRIGARLLRDQLNGNTTTRSECVEYVRLQDT